MNKDSIAKLRCTDMVRRGSVEGICVGASDTEIKILWNDSGRVPTSYARGTDALNDVTIVRKADPLLFSNPVPNRFRARRFKKS